MINEHVIKYALPDGRALKMGDVVYTVDYMRKKFFYGKCPLCKGKKTVTVSGFTFDCPKCGTYLGIEKPVLMVDSFTVRSWTLSSISENLIKHEAKQRESEIQLNFRSGKDEFCVSVRKESKRPVYLFKMNNLRKHRYSPTEDTIFFDYDQAVKRADEYNAAEAAIVADYNKKYNDHFVFERPEYDKEIK